ncbi:MAG TPA: caspase family protein [Caulobacteraceae bacterium]|nr:caspase family protein [Caulobacteraceae bacterium]
MVEGTGRSIRGPLRAARALLLAVAVIAWAGMAFAQASPRRIALVIANGAYAHTGSLRNPAHDAELVRGSLRQAGFELVDAPTDLGVAQFRDALRKFSTETAGAEVALVYYAGHGIEALGRNWLIPTDAVLQRDADLDYEAIDLDLVLRATEGAKIRVVVLDACRNNPFGRKWRQGARAVSQGLAPVDVDDVLVIYSAAPGQTAQDGSGVNSPFAEALAHRLPQAGLPIQLLGGLVRDDVLSATGGQQRPYISASITGSPFVLVAGRPAAAAPPTPPAQAAVATRAPPPVTVDPNAMELALWNAVSTSDDPAQLRAYVEKYPGGTFAGAARAKIAALTRPPPKPAAAAPAEPQRFASRPEPSAPMAPAPQVGPHNDPFDLSDASAVRTYAQEAGNWNVFPQDQLRDASVIGTYTPTSIPGGRVISTGELEKAIQAHRLMALIDVLTGYHNTIPGAVSLPGAGLPQSADVSPQIMNAVRGNRGVPLVFFCAGAKCWESYNAALRAIHAGFTNVYWYRGGLEAWAAAHQSNY